MHTPCPTHLAWCRTLPLPHPNPHPHSLDPTSLACPPPLHPLSVSSHLTLPVNSWVSPEQGWRLFFVSAACLPSKTEDGLKKWRTEELKALQVRCQPGLGGARLPLPCKLGV